MMDALQNRTELAKALGYSSWEDIGAILDKVPYRKAPIRHKGKPRTTFEPNPTLKRIQRRLNKLLQAVFVPPDTVHGHVKGRSAITNARMHVGRRWVVNLDLEQFFASISVERLALAIHSLLPFADQEVASCIAQIGCYQGKLVVGAPCSGTLSNIFMRPIDEIFSVYGGGLGCIYTRYVDDMSFSSNSDFFPSDLARCVDGGIHVGSLIGKLLTEYGLTLNDAKTRIAGRHQRQVVTGIVVNERLNVPRRFLNKLWSQISEWRRLGEEAAAERFMECRRRKCRYRSVVLGRVSYVGAIRGRNDRMYKRLLSAVTQLCESPRAYAP